MQPDLSTEEVLDITLQTMQNEGIELVEWHAMLHKRMKVPLVITVSDQGYSFLHSL